MASDPTKYSEAFLGKSNEEYCTWILDSEKWGGAIELSILADYYGREIAAYDIQTTRCDLYGQEKKYSERVMLIYDGLHYDALAVCGSYYFTFFFWLILHLNEYSERIKLPICRSNTFCHLLSPTTKSPCQVQF